MVPPYSTFTGKLKIVSTILNNGIEQLVVRHSPTANNEAYATISSLQSHHLSQHDQVQLKEAMGKYEELLKCQEIVWGQKSRVQWLKSGDRKTKFFHATTITHRRRNNIFYLNL